MSKQYTYIERRIPATPRNKRLTDAIVAASSTGGGYIGGGGGASYWQLVTTDADGNALAEEDQYLVPVGAYNVMSEMDVVAYSTGGRDIILPIASSSALGAIKVGNGLSIDSNGVLSATGAGSIAGINVSPNTGNVLTGATLSADGKTITFTKDVTALTTANYTTTLDTRYVKRSGDTMTGALTATRFVSNVATGTSPLSVSSTTLCSNLNADMLDGLHSASLFREAILNKQDLDADNLTDAWCTYTSPSDIGTWDTGWSNFPTSRPDGSFFLLNIKEGDYKKQLYGCYKDSHLYIRTQSFSGVARYWHDWKTIALTTDNVASATKLQTARAIWGQNFDGTAPVSGDMTGVGSITASGTIKTSADIIAYSTGSGDIVLPIASASALGTVKVGDGLSIASDGTLSATGAGSIGNVVVDGTGNAITTASASGTQLVLTKGITFWHGGNDGSGSGLDADLLDGKHNGELTAAVLKTIDTRGVQESPGDLPQGLETYFKSKSTVGISGPDFTGILSFKPWYDFTGGPAYQISFVDSPLLFVRQGGSSGWGSWKQIAYITDTVSNSDMLDGIHANGLFTNLSNSGNNLSVTIGGTNKTLTVGYASNAGNADTLDGLRATSFARSGVDYLSFTTTVAYNQWNRVAKVTALNNGDGVSFVITIGTHHASTVNNVTFICSASYGGRISIREFSGANLANISIRISGENYPGEVYIDLMSNSSYTDTGETYRVKIIGLMCASIASDFVTNSSPLTYYKVATSHTTGAITTDGVIEAGNTIKSTSDVIAYSTGTAAAPFKYWRPSFNSSTGKISWSNSISEDNISDFDVATPSATKAATLITAGVNTSTDIGSVGTPSVNVSAANGKISFTFHKLKGATGASISEVKLSGNYNSASEGTNTYNVYVGKTNVGSFTVTNGAKGATGDASTLITTMQKGGTDRTIIIPKEYPASKNLGAFGGRPADAWQYFFISSLTEAAIGWIKEDGSSNMTVFKANRSGSTINCTATNGAFINGSDARRKKIISKCNITINDIISINNYHFRWKDEDDSAPIKCGVLAQDLLANEELKSFVTTTSDENGSEFYGVNYGGLGVAIAVGGIKELHALIKSQQAKIDELERRLSILETK